MKRSPYSFGNTAATGGPSAIASLDAFIAGLGGAVAFDFKPETNGYSDVGGTTPSLVGGSLKSVKSGLLLAVASSTSFTLVADEAGRNACRMDATGYFSVAGVNLATSRNCSLHIVHRADLRATKFGFGQIGTGSAQFVFGNNDGTCFQNTIGLNPATILGLETTVLSFTSTPSGCSMRQAGASFGTSASTLADDPQTDFDVLGFNSSQYFPGGVWHRAILCSPALSGGNLTTLESLLIAAYPPNTMPLTKTAVVFHGNSLVYGTGTTTRLTDSMPAQTLTLLGSTYDGRNRGLGGQYTTQMTTGAPADVDPYYDAGRVGNVCVGWEIHNDILVAAQTGAQAFANYQAYRTARAAVFGAANVILLDCLPSTAFNGTTEPYRVTANADLAGEYTTATANPRIWKKAGGGVLVQVSAIAALSDPSNVTYYADGIHLTTAGAALVAADVAAAIPLR